ncbi:DUF4169 family protein [Cognatiyoonia sp.]|uniref:DUF4169 family protein n=1 Tax=Cognatiyoonia sp. TaxID=2211652 RepID=UPI003F6A32EC
MKPINLNKVRKAKARAEEKARAVQNSIKFGRTKAERMLDAARNEQASKRLSELKFEDD